MEPHRRANTAKLVGIGAVTCITSIFYTYAMSVLPVPLALTLLFQFTWIGTVIQVAITRRPPAASQVVSALIIVFGTVFASGLYAADLSSCNPWGIAAGLVAAVSCAAFMALSGHVQPECSQAQRGFLICGGAVVMSHLICPDFIVSGVLVQGIAPLGLIAGACGFFLPVLLFSIGTPHLHGPVHGACSLRTAGGAVRGHAGAGFAHRAGGVGRRGHHPSRRVRVATAVFAESGKVGPRYQLRPTGARRENRSCM